jgi:hypothetical protein
MSRNTQRTVRKPATKYPNLRKKMQKARVKTTTAKKK